VNRVHTARQLALNYPRTRPGGGGGGVLFSAVAILLTRGLRVKPLLLAVFLAVAT